MLAGPELKDSFLLNSGNENSEDSLVERKFYMDCDPEQAVDRNERVDKLASLINTINSFGPLSAQDLIREAFQAEVQFSRSPVEALSRMTKLVALINLKLNSGLRLGPVGFGVYDCLYLNNENAPAQSLDLNLRLSEYGKKSAGKRTVFAA
jgi:hypothetical protein